MQRLEAEADEMWSVGVKQGSKQWLWIAIDAMTRQIVAVHVGDRRRDRAKPLWANMPAVYREQATFYTDQSDASAGIIPAARHTAIPKQARKTHHLERFDNTLRQRVSPLVRDTRAFSQKRATHLGAITFFIGGDNLTRAPALLGSHYLSGRS
jgi:insertion element IS1 protein InsB